MSKFFTFFLLVLLLATSLVSGCTHARLVAASTARDYGDVVRTRFRYHLVYDFDVMDGFTYRVMNMRKYQPDVFNEDGIPVRLTISDVLEESGGEWTMFFPMILSYGILPSFQTSHVHCRGVLSAAGRRIATVEVCANRGESMSFPIPFPLPMLVYSGEGSTCFASGKKFVGHIYGGNSYLRLRDECDKAMAYGIVSRLKEEEDAGRIDERFAALARSAQSLSDAAATRLRVVSDEKARHGAVVLSGMPPGLAQPFEIVACDNERGKDFAYLFELRRRGGGAVTLSDSGVIRNAFRSAIRTHYASSHPDVNPRTLVVDFTDYALKSGVVSGRVAVLSMSAESLSYDSATRKGVVRIRIGAGQFEDARRWVRRNLAVLAGGNNVVVVGDAVPKGAHFYSESEEMRDGVLVVSFRTE